MLAVFAQLAWTELRRGGSFFSWVLSTSSSKPPPSGRTCVTSTFILHQIICWLSLRIMLVYQDSYQVFVIKHQFHIKLCCTTQRWKIYWLMGMTRWGHESLNSPSKFFPKFMRVFPVKLYTESFDRFFFQNLMTHIFQNECFSALQYISLHRPPKYNEQLNLSLSDLQSTECNGTKRVWGTYPVHGFIELPSTTSVWCTVSVAKIF